MSEIKVLRANESEQLGFDWGALTWYASEALGNSPDMTIGKCVLKPGCSNPSHQHPNCSEVLVVAKGKIKHTIDGGDETTMEVGDTVSIPPGILHNATNIGAEEAELFISFSSAQRETCGE